MAITSFGYGVDSTNTEGEIGVIQWSIMSTYLGAQYAVGDGGLVPSIPASGDRTVAIGAGEAYTHGVLSVSDSPTTLQFAAPSSGTRWYIGGMRFDWNEPVTEFAQLAWSGSSISAALAMLNRQPGNTVDMPLFAARVVAGQAKVMEIVDLRVFGSGSALAARSEEVLNFVTKIGTVMTVLNRQYARRINSGGNAQWIDLGENRPWASSAISSTGFNGTRRYCIRNGWAIFQMTANTTTTATNADRLILNFANEVFYPSEVAYGVAWSGFDVYRAYVSTGGEVHINPLTIAAGRTVQVQITWPIRD